MHLPKRYGESKVDKCPFCKMPGMVINSQGFSVCKDHKDAEMGEMKCICGEYLDILKGKFGVFFKCINCGPINQRKAFEINDVKDVSSKGKIKEFQSSQKANSAQSQNPRQMTVRSDDPRYFD